MTTHPRFVVRRCSLAKQGSLAVSEAAPEARLAAAGDRRRQGPASPRRSGAHPLAGRRQPGGWQAAHRSEDRDDPLGSATVRCGHLWSPPRATRRLEQDRPRACAVSRSLPDATKLSPQPLCPEQARAALARGSFQSTKGPPFWPLARIPIAIELDRQAQLDSLSSPKPRAPAGPARQTFSRELVANSR